MNAHIAVIDHRDSFTYTLVDYCKQLGATVKVFSVDELPSVFDLKNASITHLLFSPGPGHPSEYASSLTLMREASREFPILGVCLGHQMLAFLDGADVSEAPCIMHGRSSKVTHQKTGLLQDLPSPFSAMRYHSLAVNPDTLSSQWHVDAYADDDTVMAMQHRELPLFGLQYHPESILTESGFLVLKAFLDQPGFL